MTRKKRPAKKNPHHDYVHDHKILNDIEHFFDRSIPVLLIVLAVMLVTDNPFWTLYDLHHLEPWITWLDFLIVAFFVIDLTFKWFHVRKVVKFVKLYWLDLLAVMPFYLGFRVYAKLSSLVLVGEQIAEAQKVAHEAVLLREARLLREAELLREARPLTRWIRSVSRGLRFFSGKHEMARHGMRAGALKKRK
jgi:hypothetical protein